MRKEALIKKISLETDYTQGDVKAVLEALVKVIAAELKAAKQGDFVEVPSIVRFKKSMSPAVKERKQYNALLKRTMTIPERVPEPMVRPYAAKAMKDAVKG